MIKQFTHYLTSAFTDLAKNKGRTALTSLGIVIGVYSVVLLLSLGEGLKVYIEQQFESLGTNLIFVVPGKISGPDSQRSALTGARFTTTEYRRLNLALNNAIVVPVILKSTTIQTSRDEKSTSVVGSTTTIVDALNLQMKEGRFFNRNEEVGGRKVIVLGSKLTTTLFPNGGALKKTVKVAGLRFVIIGTLESKGGGGFGGPSFDDYAYSPYKPIQAFTGEKSFTTFYLKAEDKESIPGVIFKAEQTLLKKFKSDEFSVITQEELLKTISGIFGVVNSVLVGIAAISLLVGGIGITNIMYVTVTERTKEIGIRRAVGAREHNILMQFVFQAVLLTTLGGVCAILLAFLTNLAIRPFFPATITLNGVLLAFSVSFGIGVLFGVFPAQKAAKLPPVQAIRYE